ncbi:MAG: hypothetical protein ACN4EH_10695 [Methyloceanibacter sp.]|jgi:hypothetical protein|uniref:hypothetical protein n=1 Tax=Methyloceanibacter sp. TaxID=1965321 RepID=UPI003561966B
MPNFAFTHRVVALRLVLTAAVLALGVPTLAQDGRAQDAFDLSVPKPGEEAAAPANLDCGTEMLSGSGPGFTADRDDAEEAAINGWLEKAHTIYPEATWDMAKDSNLSCAVQGLYSKCFADAIPCKPKPE